MADSINNTVITRFAPSPTGRLHIGGARTALFNWLYAKHNNGRFFIRIENTDKERSSDVFASSILDDLRWLGLDWDGVIVQSDNANRHREVAAQLPTFMVDGVTRFNDFALLRSDGTPTYHLACVVDDHDMGITHVIRGNDHAPNLPKQISVYNALGWTPPTFYHIPLIHDMTGRKMSKRYGGCDFRDLKNYTPKAVMNHLLRLGWSHGDDEIISTAQAIEWFDIEDVRKSPSKFDVKKLAWLDRHYRKQPA